MEETNQTVFVVEGPEDRDTSYRRYGIYTTRELAEARVKEALRDNIQNRAYHQFENDFWITEVKLDS